MDQRQPESTTTDPPAPEGEEWTLDMARKLAKALFVKQPAHPSSATEEDDDEEEQPINQWGPEEIFAKVLGNYEEPEVPPEWDWDPDYPEPEADTLRHKLWHAAKAATLPEPDVWAEASYADRSYYFYALRDALYDIDPSILPRQPKYPKPKEGTLRRRLWEAAKKEIPPNVDDVPSNATAEERSYYVEVLYWGDPERYPLQPKTPPPPSIAEQPPQEGSPRRQLWEAAVKGSLPAKSVMDQATAEDVAYYEDVRVAAGKSCLLPAELRHAPIPYFGSKAQLVPRLIPLFPPHGRYGRYIEPYAGSGRVLLSKTRSKFEVYNDMDHNVVEMFRIIQHPEKFRSLRMFAVLSQHTRELHTRARELLDMGENALARALGCYVQGRMGYRGQLRGGYGVAGDRAHYKYARGFVDAVGRLPIIHARLQGVIIENEPALDIIDKYDTGDDAFFYLDPPYVWGTRKSGKYFHEMTVRDHARLAARLTKLNNPAILSGYNHPVYEPLLNAGWVRFWTKIPRTQKKSDVSRSMAEESIWVSPQLVDWVRWLARDPRYNWTEGN